MTKIHFYFLAGLMCLMIGLLNQHMESELLAKIFQIIAFALIVWAFVMVFFG